jgi:hypothetical protein
MRFRCSIRGWMLAVGYAAGFLAIARFLLIFYRVGGH